MLAAHSASGEMASRKEDMSSTLQCLKPHTVSFHSFMQQVFMEPLLSAIRVTSDHVINKADQVLALVELLLRGMRKEYTKRKHTNEAFTAC